MATKLRANQNAPNNSGTIHDHRGQLGGARGGTHSSKLPIRTLVIKRISILAKMQRTPQAIIVIATVAIVKSRHKLTNLRPLPKKTLLMANNTTRV